MQDTSKMSDVEFTRYLAGCDPKTGETLHPGDAPLGKGDDFWRERAAQYEKIIADQNARIAKLEERVSVFADAINHVARRTQVDPDFRWHVCPATETFELVAKAVAVDTGKDIDYVRTFLARDMQPEYRKRKPYEVELRDEIARLEKRLAEHGVEHEETEKEQ